MKAKAISLENDEIVTGFIPTQPSKNKRWYSREFAKQMGLPVDLIDYLKFLSYLRSKNDNKRT